MRGIADRLLKMAEDRILILVNGERDRSQLARLAGDDPAAVLSLPLIRVLAALAQNSSREAPLKVISLFRPLTTGRSNEPHGNGLAVDITAFAGNEINGARPEDCEKAVLALIDSLPPGAYRLGLPMPPFSAPIPLLPPPDRRPDWPFFPPPLAEVESQLEIVLPKLGKTDSLKSSRLRPTILRWANARYAPLADIQSDCLRTAIAAARARGVHIHSLFPDGQNHLHLDTKPTP